HGHTGGQRDAVCRNGLHRSRASGISLETVGRSIRWAIVEEWIQVRRIEIHSEAAAHDEIAFLSELVRKSDARRKIAEVFGINAVNTVSLEDQASLAGSKHGQIFLVVPQWPFIVPSQAVI